jgi:phosphoglucosamine mutase
VAEIKFGTDGIRAPAETVLNDEACYKIGLAVGQVLGTKHILLGIDTRESSIRIANALNRAFNSLNIKVDFSGVIPTPGLSMLSKSLNCYAIMVTASHNPYEYNGIKVFNTDGRKVPDETERLIEAEINARAKYLIQKEVPLKTNHYRDKYVEWLKSFCRDYRSLKLVIDSANGASYEIAAPIFEDFGAKCIRIGASPDGKNINFQCGATNIENLISKVLEHNADLGFAFDGDADRALAVDHLGNVVDGDQILAMLTLDKKRKDQLAKNSVVTTVMANLGFIDLMNQNNINVITTQVGDRYILSELDKYDLTLGGEQSGHIIIRDVTIAGDGLLTAISVLNLLVEKNTDLYTLSHNTMTKFPQLLYNVPVNANKEQMLKDLNKKASKWLDIPDQDYRVLIRPSGTEPVIRIMVEARNQKKAEEIMEDIVG